MKSSGFFSLSSHMKKSKTTALPVQEVPKKITATYVDDYNILEIDTIICRLYNNEEKRAIYSKYLEENRQLVDEYKKFYHTPKVISFGSKSNPKMQKNDSLTDEQLEFRHNIIENYLENAKKYLDIDVRREFPKSLLCPNCEQPLEDVYVDDNGIQCCPNCGLEKITFTTCSKLINKSNLSKNDYEDKKNFQVALHKYECKQLNRFPKKLFSDLDEYFTRERLLIGAQVKELPLNERGLRGKTTRNMLLTALSATGYSDYYVDCSLIGHLYFGWKSPDVSHLEDKIMEYYDITQRVFNNLDSLDRTSSPNIQYRLFKHLQQCGHNCTIDDFKIVKTPEILENLERIWKIMCDQSGLPYIPTL